MEADERSVYAARRARLMEAIGDGGVAILSSGHEVVRSRDTEYVFRASSDVLYLTGFDEPEAVVVLAPGHASGPLVMFVRPKDKLKEIWSGRRAGVEGAVDVYGANTAYTLDELDEKLPELLEEATALHISLGSDAGLDAKALGAVRGLRKRRGKPPAGPNTLIELRDTLDAMRLIKDPHELALLRRACAITAEAHVAAMKACAPGMREYQLQALIEHTFVHNGAMAPAYATIVGGGVNATILHYIRNKDVLNAGDVVLIDAGAEYRGYAGDITRTFPVSGRFTPAQRDVYQAVLEAEEAAIAMCVPGTTWLEIHEATIHRLTQSMVDLGLLEGDVDALIEDKKYERFYMHKTGHWLGLDVHDVGSYYQGQASRPLEPGIVQTIEPGLYIEHGAEDIPEAFWGIGVRIEDDVLTTADGFEVLTSGVPKAVDEVEALVGSGYRLELPGSS